MSLPPSPHPDPEQPDPLVDPTTRPGLVCDVWAAPALDPAVPVLDVRDLPPPDDQPDLWLLDGTPVMFTYHRLPFGFTNRTYEDPS